MVAATAVIHGNRIISPLILVKFTLNLNYRDNQWHLLEWFYSSEPGSAPIVELKTKYYSAKLRLDTVEVKSEDAIEGYRSELFQKELESAEGFIVIIRINMVHNRCWHQTDM